MGFNSAFEGSRASATPCRSNSRIPWCAPAMLWQYRVLRGSARGSRENPNSLSKGLTDPLLNSAAIILNSRQYGQLWGECDNYMWLYLFSEEGKSIERKYWIQNVFW
jgi:hypothetical protein